MTYIGLLICPPEERQNSAGISSVASGFLDTSVNKENQLLQGSDGAMPAWKRGSDLKWEEFSALQPSVLLFHIPIKQDIQMLSNGLCSSCRDFYSFRPSCSKQVAMGGSLPGGSWDCHLSFDENTPAPLLTRCRCYFMLASLLHGYNSSFSGSTNFSRTPFGPDTISYW